MNTFNIVVSPEGHPDIYSIYQIKSLKSKDDFYNDFAKAKEFFKEEKEKNEDYYDDLIQYMIHNGYQMESLCWDYIQY